MFSASQKQLNPKARKQLARNMLEGLPHHQIFYYISLQRSLQSQKDYSVRHKETGRNLTLTHHQNLFHNRQQALNTLRDIHILRMNRHPNIRRIYHVLKPTNLLTFDQLYVVSEHTPLFLNEMFSKTLELTQREIIKIVYQLLKAVGYLISAKVRLKDLSWKHLQLDNNFDLKLCNFGYLSDSHDNKSKTEKKLFKENRSSEFRSSTKWDSPPQILINGQLEQSTEMWSIGCIFGQLIMKHPQNKQTGLSFFNCSKDNGEEELIEKEQLISNFATQQLLMIMRLIGSPSSEELGFVKSKANREILKTFPRVKKSPFQHRFEHCPQQWAEFLDKALAFDPRKRISIEDAIQLPLFDPVRKEDPFKYANWSLNLAEGMSMEEIRTRFISEITFFSK